MKIILFDLISTQDTVNGGSEYTKKILNEILLYSNNIKIIGLYDSYLRECSSEKQQIIQSGGEIVDIRKYNLSIDIIIKEYEVNLLFIGILQRYFFYDLSKINCQTIVVMHDVGDLENAYNGIYKFYPQTPMSFKSKIRSFIKKSSDLEKYYMLKNKYSKVIPFLVKKNVKIVTVSNHSLKTIYYFFSELRNKNIDVLYPPLKTTVVKGYIENTLLKKYLESNRKYFLVISAHRTDKNAITVYKAFKEFVKEYSDVDLLCVGGNFICKNCINLPLLSSSDLENAYKYAYAFIYPSLQEGFGYPPLEAMKYDVPIICSNVCSMPEIYGESVHYFSPFYANDLFNKMIYVIENRDSLIDKMYLRRNFIMSKQSKDLELLISYIVNNE